MRGESVILYEKVKTGVDEFGIPKYEEIPVEVENVLIGSADTSEVLDTLNLYGKRIAYVLGIPKGDKHNWKDAKIEFYGQTFKSFGIPITGNQNLIPGDWGMNVKVEAYEY